MELEVASPAAPVALYVHFPFCLSICPYCDFVVYAGRAARGPENQVHRFVEALTTEIELRGRAARDAHQDMAPLASVYLGGGTPSLMAADDVARVLGAAEAAFGIAPGAEITLEVNPGPADRGDIAGFAAAGVNRVSIGAQSIHSDELRSLGRRHSAGDVAATVDAARSAGVDSVSIDLLYDLPGQTLTSWRASLAGTLALSPDHVSAYSLTLDEHEPADDHLVPTRGATEWRARARGEQDEDRAAEMYEIADELLARAGLRWYEISNWSRPGHESRHNLCYWQSESWEAVGPGGHAFDGERTRRWNAALLAPYVAALELRHLPPGGAQTSDAAAAESERTILALRTAAGVPAQRLGDALGWAIAGGLVESLASRVRLTRRGRLLSNELFSRLLPGVGAAVTPIDAA